MLELLLIILVATAYLVKGATGFGPAIIVMAFGTFLVPAELLVVIVSVIDFMAGLALYSSIYAKSHFRIAGPILVGLPIGIASGLTVAEHLGNSLFEAFLGVVLLVIGIYQICTPDIDRNRNPKTSPVIGGITGVGSGFLGALFSIDGPLIAMYLNSRMTLETFRATITFVFIVSSLGRNIGFGLNDRFTELNQHLVMILILVAVVSVSIGAKLSRRVSVKFLQKLIAFLISFAGFLLIVRSTI